ncbi:peptide deformylase [Prauserella sp. PE36]|uniref:Peptide deformylase n=1 Tax=Prauserella endophytica TaxID=1592324 RepID=A0ABY2S1K0_9PSEU|nr:MULTISPECIES: peptide deformylase [Prauserella]PXY25019.1 peptide deformylase [Prauserella coralliicola]RBM23826.1 peptide deformylase [Prauserella sp. PE36]TKG69095.1 peptide deformylase [Prauserella endophytica]
MAVRDLRYFGDPVLKTVADPVTRFDASVKALVDDLLQTVDLPGRAGLAAPQIGVSLRAFSYNVKGELGYVLNPEIVELSEETQEVTEGCLSVPELWFTTVRARYAVVRGVDVRNEPVTVEGSGLMAQCLQHETDHLDGKLYLDRLDKDQRRQALREARQRDWFWSR